MYLAVGDNVVQTHPVAEHPPQLGNSKAAIAFENDERNSAQGRLSS